MQVGRYQLERHSPSNEAAVRRVNAEHGALPTVLVRFMSNMFGEGGYRLTPEPGRADVWTFDTELCHYRFRLVGEAAAVVMAWPKGTRYKRDNATAIWKIGVDEG